LVLVALLLAMGTSEGESDSRQAVQASETLAAIKRGEIVETDFRTDEDHHLKWQ